MADKIKSDKADALVDVGKYSNDGKTLIEVPTEFGRHYDIKSTAVGHFLRKQRKICAKDLTTISSSRDRYFSSQCLRFIVSH